MRVRVVALAAALISILFGGCGSRTSVGGPTVAFTRIPLAEANRTDKLDVIQGSVSGAKPGQQIILYARAGAWWLQPLPNAPFTKIQDSNWVNSTHLGTEYAALLVEPGYRPRATLEELPSPGGEVVAVATAKGAAAAPSPTLQFSGYEWRIRTAPSSRGDTMNLYDPANAWTDADGALHLRIAGEPGKWTCAEVALTRSFGYGTYTFVVRDTSQLEPAAVLAMFTWDYAVWRAFENRYWPALYFADARGRVRHHHFGEGDYEQSERVIQQLLAEAGAGGAGNELVSVAARGIEAAADWASLKTPENYVGYGRTENFASPGGALADERRVYAAPARLSLNQWALAGDWTIGRQAVGLNKAGGRIACRFQARDLHLVMGPSARGASVRFRVALDGQPAGVSRGDDVDGQGHGTVTEQRLYQLIRQPKPITDRRFEIEFLDPGAEAFAFTFG